MIGREKLDRAWECIQRKRSKKYIFPDCHALKIECIGSPRVKGPGQAYVERIVGLDDNGDFKRTHVQGFTDYAKANSVGSRGVMKNYILKSNNIYFVSSPQTWNQIEQYFCRVKKGELIRMNVYQVLAWLKNHWV